MRVERGLLDDVPLEEPPVACDERGGRRSCGPTAHFSHQYGECRAWAWWLPSTVEPGGAQLGLQLGARSRCARGRRRAIGAWYSSRQHPVDLLGQPRRHGGGEACRPGCSTRTSSASAPTSSWMCSSTSDVITRSNVPSANGSRVASPRSTPTQRSAAISPASTIAAERVAGARRPRRRRSRGRRRGRRGGRTRTRGGRSRHRRRAPGRPGCRPSSSKRIVSTQTPRRCRAQLGHVLRHRQHLAVLLDGQLGAAAPAPSLDHPAPAGGADAGAELGVVEAAADASPPARRRRRPGTTARSRRRCR